MEQSRSIGIWVNLRLAPSDQRYKIAFGGTFNLGSISLNLDGDWAFNSSAKERAYQDVFQQKLGTVSLDVTNNIWRL